MKKTEYTFRPLTAEDAPAAAKLWSLVFGDEEAVVLEFFRLFARHSSFGVCAEAQGSIVAAAYCPDEMEFIASDGSSYKGCYLYAVATHPDHRKQKLAQTLCTMLKDTARSQGKDLLFTRPAEDSLYPWYEEKIGAVPLFGCRKLTFAHSHAADLPHRQLTAEEYSRLRSQCLCGLPHVHQSLRWMEWEQSLHEAYGGGFYAVGDFIADIYCDGSSAAVSELLPHSTDRQAEEVCGVLMSVTGASSCQCLLHGTDPYVSVAPLNAPLPVENGWFGPCFG